MFCDHHLGGVLDQKGKSALSTLIGVTIKVAIQCTAEVYFELFEITKHL